MRISAQHTNRYKALLPLKALCGVFSQKLLLTISLQKNRQKPRYAIELRRNYVAVLILSFMAFSSLQAEDLQVKFDPCVSQTSESNNISVWCAEGFDAEGIPMESFQRKNLSADVNIDLSTRSALNVTSDFNSTGKSVEFKLPDDVISNDDDYRLDVSAGYDIELGSINIKPYGQVSVSQGQKASASPKSYSLGEVSGQNKETAVGVGANVSKTFQQSWGEFKPYASINVEEKQVESLTGAETDPERNFKLGVGFETGFSERAKAFMSYENSLNSESGDRSNTINAGVEFNY